MWLENVRVQHFNKLGSAQGASSFCFLTLSRVLAERKFFSAVFKNRRNPR